MQSCLINKKLIDNMNSSNAKRELKISWTLLLVMSFLNSNNVKWPRTKIWCAMRWRRRWEHVLQMSKGRLKLKLKSKKWENYSLSKWMRNVSEKLLRRHSMMNKLSFGRRTKKTTNSKRSVFKIKLTQSTKITSRSCRTRWTPNPQGEQHARWTSRSSFTIRAF